jgi:hypothetical protein
VYSFADREMGGIGQDLFKSQKLSQKVSDGTSALSSLYILVNDVYREEEVDPEEDLLLEEEGHQQQCVQP